MSRHSFRDQMDSVPLDVLVVGGGIVGAGVARDAAMRGLRTGIIDRHDFAFGTSSRSSRLLHGGLRYLEQGRIGLVREASIEKRVLHRIAPHLAQPLGFVFPTYAGDRPLWQLRIGVKLYDLLCGGRNFQPSSSLTRAETSVALPALDSHDLAGAVRYFDALTNDARLTLDTIRSAAHHHALAANYTRFCAATRDAGIWNCELEDTLDGQRRTVRARTVVNATGPWAQALPHSQVRLRLTKGIHVVVERSRLPVTDAVVITEGRRIIFVIPWGQRLIVGTTDTDYDGQPEHVSVEANDIDYVLRTVNAAFPTVALRENDVISSWAGLRPLIASPDGSPSDISRGHQIRTPEPGWWDIAGGKLTTYRLMAEQAVDAICRHLSHQVARCRTADEPLLPANETLFSGILPPSFGREAVNHFVREEWAATLGDVMIRRSGWHYYHSDAAAKAVLVADWMAAAASWSPERRRAELEAYLQGALPVQRTAAAS